MKREVLTIHLKLRSDTIFSSGSSVPGGEDIALRIGPDGYPLLAGSTFKGLLRESMENWLCWTDGDPETLDALFGREGWSGADDSRRLIFSDLRLSSPPGDPSDCFDTRAFTALENGTVKQATLRLASCLRSGLVFEGIILCDNEDAALVCDSISAIKWAGLMRNRGFGRVKLFAQREQESSAPAFSVGEASCLHYRLKLETPMSIPWLDRNNALWEELNFTETREYLPGSAVRGMVVSYLAQEEPVWFQNHKSVLLGNGTRFLNALPLLDGMSSIPTPRGFCEDKALTRFYSTLLMEKEPGDKQAVLGAFCRLENGAVVSGTPASSNSLRIRRGADKQVFTVRRLEAGTVLEGYIQLDDPALAPIISRAFRSWVWLGADRYAGSGLCHVEYLRPVDTPHWTRYGYGPDDLVPNKIYMLLLSPAAMSQNGEACGLDEKQLAKLLKVETVAIFSCASSVVEIAGYNRTWGCKTPSVAMYDSGSVFLLNCTPAPPVEALDRLQRVGMGLRRSEGCGQVLFLKDYELLNRRSKPEDAPPPPPTPADLYRQARCRWLLETKLPAGPSKSQIGSIQAQCELAIQQGGDDSQLCQFLEHNLHGRGAYHGNRFAQIKEKIETILNTPLCKTLGVENLLDHAGNLPPDNTVERLRLLCDWMDLSRKGEKKK